MNSASLCSLAGRYDNPIPTRLLAPIDCLKIPALKSRKITQILQKPTRFHKNTDFCKNSIDFAHFMRKHFCLQHVLNLYFISAEVSIFGPEEQSSDFGQTFVIRGSHRDVVYLGHGLINHTEAKAFVGFS